MTFSLHTLEELAMASGIAKKTPVPFRLRKNRHARNFIRQTIKFRSISSIKRLNGGFVPFYLAERERLGRHWQKFSVANLGFIAAMGDYSAYLKCVTPQNVRQVFNNIGINIKSTDMQAKVSILKHAVAFVEFDKEDVWKYTNKLLGRASLPLFEVCLSSWKETLADLKLELTMSVVLDKYVADEAMSMLQEHDLHDFTHCFALRRLAHSNSLLTLALDKFDDDHPLPDDVWITAGRCLQSKNLVTQRFPRQSLSEQAKEFMIIGALKSGCQQNAESILKHLQYCSTTTANNFVKAAIRGRQEHFLLKLHVSIVPVSVENMNAALSIGFTNYFEFCLRQLKENNTLAIVDEFYICDTNIDLVQRVLETNDVIGLKEAVIASVKYNLFRQLGNSLVEINVLIKCLPEDPLTGQSVMDKETLMQCLLGVGIKMHDILTSKVKLTPDEIPHAYASRLQENSIQYLVKRGFTIPKYTAALVPWSTHQPSLLKCLHENPPDSGDTGEIRSILVELSREPCSCKDGLGCLIRNSIAEQFLASLSNSHGRFD